MINLFNRNRAVDLTLPIDPGTSQGNAPAGHIGTHIDTMGKDLPLQDIEVKGIIFDVSFRVFGTVGVEDVYLPLIKKGMFIAFHTGIQVFHPYGSDEYGHEHPILSDALLEELIKRGVSFIGIDFAGVKRGEEHTPADQHLADKGIFVIENLHNMEKFLSDRAYARVNVCISPVQVIGSGMPCHVIARGRVK